jgi:hypothetical protein
MRAIRTSPPSVRRVVGCSAQIAALIALAAPLAASAFPFELNEDVRGAWNTTLVVGAGIRAQNPQAQFVGFGNANQFPGPIGAVNVADDGNLNFRRGDLVSAPVTLMTDLELRYRNQFGAFARVRACYDMVLADRGMSHGHVPNGYVPGARLDDSNFYTPNKFSGAELLDAFAYANLDLGENRLAARIGKQSLNWGESLLYPGINAFNPLNYSALGRPGARLEEALVPVNRVWGTLSVAKGLSVEGFYALDWTRSNLPPCGTFGSVIDNTFDPGCNFATGAAPLPDRVTYALALGARVAPEVATGKWGQWGAAARYFAEPLSTEFGLYYVRYNSPSPNVNVIPGVGPLDTQVQVQYLENVQAFALSAATGIRNVALSAELSRTIGLGGQRNFPTLIQGIGGGGPYAAPIAASGIGNTFPGGLPLNKTQLQFGGTADVSPLIGPYDVSITGEVVMQWATNLPGLETERIGRNPNFGTASYNGVCQGGYNVCSTEGFATRYTWGYRILVRASLPQPALGLVLQPVLLFSQDVKGYSFEGTLVQGRIIVGPVLRAIYQRRYFAEIGAVLIKRNTEFDGVRDRSAYTIALGLSI